MSTARLLRLPQLARLLTIALTLALAIGLLAPRGHAAPLADATRGTRAEATHSGAAPQPGLGTTANGDGEQRPVPASDRAPLPVKVDPEAAQPADAPSGRSLAADVQACNVGDFTGRTGDALVQQIKSADLQCVNTLFQLAGTDASNAFRESQMTTVAYALRDTAGNYPGDDSTSVAQLVLYLRAGYFVQWYNPVVVGPYGTALQTAIRAALDAFFANSHSRDVTSGNGSILGEAVTLIDSAQENTRYLYVVKRLLTDYDSATWNPAGLGWAVNPVFTVLFRGHQLADFPAAVQADPSVLDALNGFASRTGGLFGGSYQTLPYNADRELGRFLKYPALQAKVRPFEQALAAQSSPGGTGAYQWAAVAEMTDAFDTGNCAYYGTCDAANRLKAANLTVTTTCSPSIRILAQALDSTQLAATCASLNGQDAYFHSVVRDSGPVKDDYNSTIEVVVFHSSFDYGALAGIIYGISTNNGGMYLEGNPADPKNQPRFVAYEAEWARPAFQIWNLNHEYTHYLDGRFDMYGDFAAGQTTPTVWWLEGFAEFVSYSYRKVTNDAAIAAAARHTYKLSDLFDTTYDNADQERIYRWGYLAVRYMLEQHRADMDALLAKYRVGDWAGGRTLLKTTIGTRYDADFDSWLTACGNGACANTPTVPSLPECTGADTRQLNKNCARSNVAATTGNYAHFYVLVPPGTQQLKITSSGGTGNGDLYYNPSSWAYTGAYTARSAGPDNNETLTVTNPPAGYVYFSLYAQQGFSGVSVTSEF
ncbi:M9 family metallopeptidase [Kitasatospora aureofaciens]|uniref:M9 family metallopeptidase n=1 Tax=Kitasatospora aureofaciens TaxID=1894 RepID=UPI0027E1FCD0|nr:M9 family metallopeptidase [Kitasatospora aureofaciens]